MAWDILGRVASFWAAARTEQEQHHHTLSRAGGGLLPSEVGEESKVPRAGPGTFHMALFSTDLARRYEYLGTFFGSVATVGSGRFARFACQETRPEGRIRRF